MLGISFLALRLGIAFIFLYPAFAAFKTPTDWIGFFPPSLLNFLGKFAPETYFLHAFSVGEIIIGAWLLSGWKTTHAAVLAMLVLAVITLANLSMIDIVFRDVGLALAALALAFLAQFNNNDHLKNPRIL